MGCPVYDSSGELYSGGEIADLPVVHRKSHSGQLPDAGEHRKKMKFKCIEFSWRAAFIGAYLTPERDRLWVTIIPFFPLYFKRR